MTHPRPRILIITRNLPPLVGGMERLNWHMADELSRRADVRVIGPTGSAHRRPEQVDVAEVPLRPLWRFLLASAWQAVRAAHAWQPDVVLAGSGLTAPPAWLAARCCRAKAAAYLHGLDISVHHPIYRMLWLPFIRHMDSCIVNSEPTRQLALNAGVKAEKMRTVHPGVSLPAQPQAAQAIEAFKNRHGLAGKTILLSVGRLSRRKGLLEFVQQALPLIVRERPDAVLAVIGAAPKDALHATAHSTESVRAAAEAAGVLENVRFLGNVSETELLAAYETASLHIFPIRDIPGDPEGFGMVAIEAAAHGLPTVAFATGGVVDAVAEGQSGRLVKPGDYAALAQAALQTLAGSPAEWRAKTTAFAQGFAWPRFGQRISTALTADLP
ncbi:MAG: glycosyltransferase family 4 protein [Xenophilus sp.]